MTPTQGEHAQTALAHELFAAAQLAPGEGIEDAVRRIAAALTAAPTAQAAPAAGAVAGPSLQEIQWRNIRKVVDALADFCFGSQDDPHWGVAHVAIRTSLTAKDGLDVQALKLEPLAAPTPAAQADSITKERLKEILGKPETVHLNMLNGNIAVITMEQCAHLHGEEMQRKWAAADSVLEDAAQQPRLKVRLSAFPESNGKQNWTALLVRADKWHGLVGNCGGISLARGELWNRVAYEAECARFLIGERDTEPFILDYGDDIKTPEEWKGEVHGGRKPRDAARKQGAKHD